MSNIKKFLTESSSFVETLTEQTETGKQLYITGIFAQAEVCNGNGRIYPKHVLERAVEKYNEEYVSRRVALGELNHPENPHVNPAEGAILIESLHWEGNNVIGKAKVLNTPKGQIIRGLLEGGYNMGVSTRGLGELKESNGKKIVESFMLTAIDAVSNPSGPNCYVNPIMESVSWVEKDGVWVPIEEATKELVKKEIIDEDLLLSKLSKIFK